MAIVTTSSETAVRCRSLNTRMQGWVWVMRVEDVAGGEEGGAQGEGVDWEEPPSSGTPDSEDWSSDDEDMSFSSVSGWESGEDTPDSESGESGEEDGDEMDIDSDVCDEEGSVGADELPLLIRTRPGYVFDTRTGLERKRIMMDDFVEEDYRRRQRERGRGEVDDEEELEEPTM